MGVIKRKSKPKQKNIELLKQFLKKKENELRKYIR